MPCDWIKPDLVDLFIEPSGKCQKKKNLTKRKTDNDKVKKVEKKKGYFSGSSLTTVEDKSINSKVKRVKSIGGESTARSKADLLKNVNSFPDPTFKEQFVKSWVAESMEAIESGQLAELSDEQTLPNSQRNDCVCPLLTQSNKSYVDVHVARCLNRERTPNEKAENSFSILKENKYAESSSTVSSLRYTVQVLKSPNLPRKAGQINSTTSAGSASKVSSYVNKCNTKSKPFNPKKLTPVPVQTIFKKPSTTLVPKVDPLLSILMHSQRISLCPQPNTSNLVYLKRLSNDSKHESLSYSRRTSQSSGKETSSNGKTVDFPAVAQNQNESTQFTEDVTDDLMTEDSINTTADTERRVTKMTDSTQEHTFGTLGTTDLIEGATADVMTEDLVTTYPSNCAVEIEVLRDAHVSSDSVKLKGMEQGQIQFVDDGNTKKTPNKVLTRLVDFDYVCDRSDKPDYGHGTPEYEEVDTFESLPSIPKVKIVEPKLCSTFLSDKGDDGAVLVDESTILRDDSHGATLQSMSTEMEIPHVLKKVEKAVKAKLTSTVIDGKKTNDGVLVDVSTISGDCSHGGIKSQFTEFESLPVQKLAGRVTKAILTSTMLDGKKTDGGNVVDVSTICGASDMQHGLQCTSNISLYISDATDPSTTAIKSKTSLKMHNIESTNSGNKSVHFSLPVESEHRRKRMVFTSTPSNSKEARKESFLIGLSSIAAEVSSLEGELPAHTSSREVITEEIFHNTEEDVAKEMSDAGMEKTDQIS